MILQTHQSTEEERQEWLDIAAYEELRSQNMQLLEKNRELWEENQILIEEYNEQNQRIIAYPKYDINVASSFVLSDSSGDSKDYSNSPGDDLPF